VWWAACGSTDRCLQEELEDWFSQQKYMKNSLKITLLILCWLATTTSSALAEEVVLPLTLDHKLLTSLLLHNGFSDRDQQATIAGGPEECSQVSLSRPQFTTAGKLLHLEMRLDIRLGTPLGDKCLTPVEWHGFIVLLQQPVFNGQTFSLSFATVDSSLLTLSHKPAVVANILWEFAKPKVYDYLAGIHFDLAPPISELRSFLGPLFHDEVRRATRAMLDSLHGGRVEVGQDAVVVELIAEVEGVYKPEKQKSPAVLTKEERDTLIQLWETWDTFLVRLLTTMANDSLSPQDRQVMIDVLLDTRYVFSVTLDEAQEMGKDFVRLQFVRAWRQLAPVFRRQLYAHPSDNSLGYLAFFTAADALSVLDRMGPTLGIEISQQGLLRLAEMLTGKGTTLPYSPQLDQKLRNLLQLPPTDDKETSPSEKDPDIDVPEQKGSEGPLSKMSDFLFCPVYAAEPGNYQDILKWKVPEDNVDDYLEKVRKVLADSSSTLLERGGLPKRFHGMFSNLIPAMAWQESCFRQFVVKNRKLTYLLSYNQTSVGLMQINERVWRGIYDRSRLRWDIRYNALAGCEIVDLYLRKYALKHSVWRKHPDMDLLSRVVYAMYNGGPGQYDKFLARVRADKHYRSDQLFLEKLQLVWAAKWQYVKECLTGG